MNETSGEVHPSGSANRWVILVAAVLVQLAIGAIYAWSTFAKALQAKSAFGMTKSQAALPFSIAVGLIFVGTFVGGRLQDQRGPRTVALTGGIIYSAGIILASFATKASTWPLLVGYGVLGGLGLGMVYIVPIAMLQKWFPDKRALITGLAVAGFGFGSVITSPVAQWLIGQNAAAPTKSFLPLGIAYLVLIVLGASFFRNPTGADVARFTPQTGSDAADNVAAGEVAKPRDFTVAEALRTPQWYLLMLILAMSVTAGISLIAVLAAAASDIAGYNAAGAAFLVGIMGLFNGAGRILWAAISARIGKMPAFLGILGIQGVCLLLIPHAGSAAAFAVLAAIVYTCYGGGFGTMPSTAGDFFGLKFSGGIYGLMLIAWSIGGVLGPILIASLIGNDKAYTTGFTVIGIIALVSLVLPLITRKPKTPESSPAVSVPGRRG